MSFSDVALSYVQRGWSVIPVRREDKKPLIAWKPYQTERATEAVIRGWFTQFPNANIGIVTGMLSDLGVLDFDSEESYWNIHKDYGLPETPMVRTARGVHLYCAYRGGVRNFAKHTALHGLDFRGEGG